MQRFMINTLIALAILGMTTVACAGETEDQIYEQISVISDDIDEIIDRLHGSWHDAIDDISLASIARRILNRQAPVDGAQIGQSLINHFLREVRAGIDLAAQLLGIGLLLALLTAIGISDKSDAPVRIARLVCYLAIARIAVGAFMVALTTAQNVINDLASTVVALLPTLAGVVVASGAYTTAGLFHPFMLAVVYYTGTVVSDFVLPLLMTAGLIDLVGHIAPVHRLGGIAGLLRQLGLGIMGLGLCLVIGTSTVLGAAAMAGDGIALRSIKYAAGTFIPIAGKMFADAAELVLSSSLVVKNAAGIVVAIAILLAIGLPLMKLIALGFIFRLTSALTQPLGLDDVASCISAVANSIVQFAVVVGVVAVMFFIVLAALIGASNAVTMVR